MVSGNWILGQQTIGLNKVEIKASSVHGTVESVVLCARLYRRTSYAHIDIISIVLCIEELDSPAVRALRRPIAEVKQHWSLNG
jgi:hypothetical protein